MSEVLEISNIIDGMINVRRKQTFGAGIVVSYMGKDTFVPLSVEQITPIVQLISSPGHMECNEDPDVSFEPAEDTPQVIEDDDEDFGISSV